MGTTGSVERNKKQAVAEVMAAQQQEVNGPKVAEVLSSHASPSSLVAPRGEDNVDERGSSASKSLGIRRKSQRNNNSNGKKKTIVPVPRRDITLYEGIGPIVHWKKGSLVGKGATGAVYEATDTATNGVFCVKEIEFSDDFADNPHDLQRFDALRREIELLKEIHHPNVVRFLGIDRVNFVIYIQMEYVYGGNIQDILRNFGPLSEEMACKFTQQILAGLDYLHDKGIIHRDIKGANILVGVDGVVKLADFGAAKRVLDHEQLFKTLAGTPYWMAPEVVRQEGHNKAADVWSLGATVLQMLTGSAPYQALPPVPALFKIGHSNEAPVPDGLKTSPEAIDFMRQCLTRDPTKRPTVKQLRNHPWTRKFVWRPRGSRSSTHQQQVDDADRDSTFGGRTESVTSEGTSVVRTLALQTSHLVEQDAMDEEAQIQEFVAYVSERHRALQQEQQVQCSEDLVVAYDEVPRDDGTPMSDHSSDVFDEHNRSRSLSSGHHARHQPQQSASQAEMDIADDMRRLEASAKEDHHGLDDDDSDDHHLPMIGAAAPDYHGNTNMNGTSSSGRSARAAQCMVPSVAEGHRLEVEDEEEDVGGHFEDEFDEAHFDEIISGLGKH